MHVGTPDDATPQLQNLIHLREFMPALWAQSICVKAQKSLPAFRANPVYWTLFRLRRHPHLHHWNPNAMPIPSNNPQANLKNISAWTLALGINQRAEIIS